MALTQAQIQSLQQLLGEHKAELESLLNLSESSEETVALDQSKVGRLSRMDALQQQAMAQASRSHCKQQLNAVNAALKAIVAGDYGECSECGEEIAIERLQAQPESVLCIRCKSLREQD